MIGALTVLAGACAGAWPTYAAQTSSRFSPDLLRSRGLAPELAEYYSRGPRFNPGSARVSLFVNGVSKGAVTAQFNADGDLCVTRALLKRAGLVIPDDLQKESPRSPSVQPSSGAGVQTQAAAYCYDYRAAFAQTRIKLVPNEARVEIVVPEQALQPRAAVQRHFSGGGTAALLNYDVRASRRQYGSWSNTAFLAQTEAGFNAQDWIVRSRQSITDNGKMAAVIHGAAYAQRTFAAHGMTLQVGQIHLANSVTGGAPLYGIQIVPESALSAAPSSGAAVEGIAQTEAHVEVRQAGRQIYSAIVPPGPFRLNNLPLVSDIAELTVVVTEADGTRRESRIPPTSFMTDIPVVEQGLSLAVGSFQGAGRNYPGAALTGARRVGRSTSAAVTALTSGHHNTAAAMLAFAPPAGPSVSTRLHVSHRASDHAVGVQGSVRVSGRLAPNLSANVSSSVRSRRFSHHLEAADGRRQCAAADLALGLNYAMPSFGSVSLGYAQSAEFGAGIRKQVMASLWTRVRGASISLSARCDMRGSSPARTSTYLNVNIPFGRTGAGARVSVADARARVGVHMQDTLGEDTRYRASVERSHTDGRTAADLGLSHQSGYASLSAGLFVAPQALSYWSGLRGGMVFHDAGVSFSPYPIRDTFGIASTSGVPNVRLTTPAGSVRTDRWGRAVLPSLPAYKRSSLQISTESLPRNADVDNGFKAVNPGRGSVQQVEFNVTTVRRVLLDVQTTDGTPIKRGGPVYDRDGGLVATAIDDRRVFLPNATPDAQLQLQLADGRYCKLTYTLPAQPDTDRSFEPVKAKCIPVSQAP